MDWILFILVLCVLRHTKRRKGTYNTIELNLYTVSLLVPVFKHLNYMHLFFILCEIFEDATSKIFDPVKYRRCRDITYVQDLGLMSCKDPSHYTSEFAFWKCVLCFEIFWDPKHSWPDSKVYSWCCVRRAKAMGTMSEFRVLLDDVRIFIGLPGGHTGNTILPINVD